MYLDTTSQAETDHAADNGKSVTTANGGHLARIGIGLQYFNYGAPRNGDLLLLLARVIAMDGMVDVGRLLQRQIVQLHPLYPFFCVLYLKLK